MRPGPARIREDAPPARPDQLLFLRSDLRGVPGDPHRVHEQGVPDAFLLHLRADARAGRRCVIRDEAFLGSGLDQDRVGDLHDVGHVLAHALFREPALPERIARAPHILGLDPVLLGEFTRPDRGRVDRGGVIIGQRAFCFGSGNQLGAWSWAALSEGCSGGQRQPEHRAQCQRATPQNAAAGRRRRVKLGHRSPPRTMKRYGRFSRAHSFDIILHLRKYICTSTLVAVILCALNQCLAQPGDES